MARFIKELLTSQGMRGDTSPQNIYDTPSQRMDMGEFFDENTYTK
jgi:hypothetical protein